MVDWQKVREEFPALRAWTFLNSATYGQMPRRAVAAVDAHFARRDALACADFMDWFDDADAIRASIARLIHCEAEDIAFIPNASTALSLLLRGLDWRRGDRIVTLEHEFPNHYYLPEVLRARGVEFVETPMAGFYDAVAEQTRVVLMSTLSYSTGFRPPVEEIGAYLRRKGVLFYLDGTQSVGALRFDVSRVQPDLFAVHGYKWLLAPNGAGFMYVAPALRARLEPAVVGWRSHGDWRRPESLHHGAPVFAEAAEKYEGAMLAFPLIYAMGASVEMFLELGPEAIERRVLELAAGVRRVLRDAGAEVLSDSPIVTARFPGRDAPALVAALQARGVLVAARQGNLRVSAHFYNNEQDLARLAEALAAAGR